MSSLNRKHIVIKYFLLIFGLFVFVTNIAISPKKKSPRKNSFIIKNGNTIAVPFLQKDFVGFKEALAFKESQGKYTVVNTLGYLGKYQFGKTTLERFRIYNTKAFLKNPELQERAFIALCKLNKWILRKDIQRSVGKTINGIKITESGILAAAHLSGAGNVKKYLRSNGVNRFSDAFGSSIKTYIKKFEGYDVSSVSANRKPIV